MNIQQLITPLIINIFQQKFGTHFGNLYLIKPTKSYPDSFRFDIFIIRCLGGYFFPDTVYIKMQ